MNKLMFKLAVMAQFLVPSLVFAGTSPNSNIRCEIFLDRVPGINQRVERDFDLDNLTKESVYVGQPCNWDSKLGYHNCQGIEIKFSGDSALGTFRALSNSVFEKDAAGDLLVRNGSYSNNPAHNAQFENGSNFLKFSQAVSKNNSTFSITLWVNCVRY